MKSHPVFEKLRIFAPGPTPVPEEVLAVLSRSPLHHRTKEFSQVLGNVREGLKYLFQTEQPVYVLASSGSGAMETTIVNLFSQGDEVLTINGGKFGERWGKIAARFGLQVHTIDVPWGQAVSTTSVAEALKAHPKIKGVLFQASETSTGAFHPVKEIAETVRANSDALVIVDAITALGVVNLPMDEWKLDAVVSGSQKALMLPPGLAFLALSQKAHAARKESKIPKFYFDLNAEDKAMGTGQTAWTPAVSLISGLEVILQNVQKCGLPALFSFHDRLAAATRAGVQAMGLKLFAPDAPSAAVTAVEVPSSIEDGKKIVSYLRDRFAITIAGGQDDYKGKIFRIGHLGFYDELDILTILGALDITLRALGHECTPGAGVGAASTYFLEARA
ncbi:MAG: alanine--glyoxylate aminotransferase family protein [Bdellovibrionota bacterium]